MGSLQRLSVRKGIPSRVSTSTIPSPIHSLSGWGKNIRSTYTIVTPSPNSVSSTKLIYICSRNACESKTENSIAISITVPPASSPKTMPRSRFCRGSWRKAIGFSQQLMTLLMGKKLMSYPNCHHLISKTGPITILTSLKAKPSKKSGLTN